MSSKLTALNKLFRKRSLLDRIVRTCITDPRERTILSARVGDLTDWKWEYTAAFLYDIREPLMILQRRFDPNKVMSGAATDPNTSNIDPNLMKELADLLKDQELRPKCEVLRCVAWACNREATKLEGCRCHEHILSGPGKWRDRVRQYRLASSRCVWKGRRGLEMSMGRLDAILNNIQSAGDDGLRTAYADVSHDIRRQMQSMEHELKAAVKQQLKDKL
eukprot:713455-Pyramimonas_sp.AAC.1